MILKKLIFVLTTLLITVSASAAGGSKFGFNGAFSIPFLSQYGLNWVNDSNSFSAELMHSGISLTITDVTISGKVDELIFRWHPFSGSFFLGAGVGQKTITCDQNQVISSQTVNTKIEFKTSVLMPTLGWMWGASDGGFFGGFDVGYQIHSGFKTTVTTSADNTIKATSEYIAFEKNITDQGEKLGKVPLPVITLLRIGYLF